MWMVLFLMQSWPPRMQNGGNMKVSHHPGGDGCNPGRGKTSQGVCIFLKYLPTWMLDVSYGICRFIKERSYGMICT